MFYRCFFSLNVAPSFDNGWTNHNVDCCVNTINGKITTAKKLVNFGPVTLDLVAHLHRS